VSEETLAFWTSLGGKAAETANLLRGFKPEAIEPTVYSEGDRPEVIPFTPDNIEISGTISDQDYLKNNRYLKGYSFNVPSGSFYSFDLSITGSIKFDLWNNLTLFTGAGEGQLFRTESDTFLYWINTGTPHFRLMSTSDFSTGSFSISARKYLNFAVNGTVKNSLNQNIDGLAILQNTVSAETKTAEITNGAYAFEFEAASETEAWELKITAPDYADYIFPDPIVQSDIIWPTGIIKNATLARLEMDISGTVTDSDSNPIADATVQLLRASDSNLERQATTDASGNYSISDFKYSESAQYFIRAIHTEHGEKDTAAFTPQATVSADIQFEAVAVETTPFNFWVQVTPISGAERQIRVSGTDSPRLTLEWNGGSQQIYADIQNPVAISLNDGTSIEEDPNSLYLGKAGEIPAFLFKSVSAPANITSAKLSFTSNTGIYNYPANAVSVRIEGIKNRWIGEPQSPNEFDMMPETTANLTWEGADENPCTDPDGNSMAWQNGARYEADITAIAQEILTLPEYIELIPNAAAYQANGLISTYTTTGNPDRNKYFHKYKFSATAGTLYQIEAQGPDTWMAIYTQPEMEELQRLAYDDDSGTNFGSLLNWQCTESGTYYIGVASYSGGQSETLHTIQVRTV
jgi:hypothetical protein